MAIELVDHYVLAEQKYAYDQPPVPPELIEANRLAQTKDRNPLLKIQPFKLLYIIYVLLSTLLISIPFWAIYYFPEKNRQRQGWPLTRCLRISAMRRLQGVVARCEIDHLGRDLSFEPPPESLLESHHTWIPPAPETLIAGFVLSSAHSVESARGSWKPFHSSSPKTPVKMNGSVPRGKRRRWKHGILPWENRDAGVRVAPVAGFWYQGKKMYPEQKFKPIDRKKNELVGLFFHGGAYLAGSALETDGTARIPKSLIASTKIKHVLSVDYRISHCNPFPSCLLDAISAYYYLLQFTEPENIIFFGDSAGGNLALGLMRYIRDEGFQLGLPKPGGLVVFSPWCDMSFSHHVLPGSSSFLNKKSDIIHDNLPPHSVSLFLRGSPTQIMNSPYLSPAALSLPKTVHQFEGFPKTFIVAGESERMTDEIRDLVQRVELGIGKENVEYLEVYGAPHDFVIFPWMADERRLVFSQLDNWLADNFEIAHHKKSKPSPFLPPAKDEEGLLETAFDLGSAGLEMFDSSYFLGAANSSENLVHQSEPSDGWGQGGEWEWSDDDDE